MNNQAYIQDILSITYQKHGMDLLESITSHFYEVWGGDVVFIGTIKDRVNDIVMGFAANRHGDSSSPFEYCSLDQPCYLMYRGERLNIPCGVQSEFKRKTGSGLESFIGFPITHPSEGVIAHFAAYSSEKDKYVDVSPNTMALIELIISREIAHILAREKQEAFDSIKAELDVWRIAALTDPLTKLHNRRSLEENWFDRKRTGTIKGASVSLIDIDHFKRLNDTFGHDCGDACLEFFATGLRDFFRGKDIQVYRLGGEEFCCIAFDSQRHNLAEELETFRKAFAENCVREMKLPTFTFSAGIADANSESEIYTVLSEADALLYQAKAEGRDRVISQS